jgi:hypothetical protein
VLARQGYRQVDCTMLGFNTVHGIPMNHFSSKMEHNGGQRTVPVDRSVHSLRSVDDSDLVRRCSTILFEIGDTVIVCKAVNT